LNGTVTAGAANFIELDSGFYTMRGYNTALGCYSDPVTIEVTEDFILPSISLTEQGATNCDPNLPNGMLTADIGGVVTGYTFKWVDGTDVEGAEWSPVSGTERETAELLLAGDTYTVKATTDATGCFSTLSRIMSDSSELPLVSLVQTPNTVCDDIIAGAFDGTISGTINYQGGVVADHTPYQYVLFEGNDTTGVVVTNLSGVAPDFIELVDGDYTMRAYDFALGCFSNPISISVQDATVLPNILLTTENNSSCDDARPNGNIQAYVDVIGNTVDHDFTWFDGGTTTDPVLANIYEIRDLPGNQNYTVEVMNQTTGCVNTLSTFLGKNIPVLGFRLDVTDIIDCNIGGSVLATIDSAGTGDVVDYTNYVFYWYKGPNLDPGNELPETTRHLQDIMYSDFYTVYAENTYTHCMTDSITGYVNPPPPLFTIDHELNFIPSDCNTNEGAITASVGGNITNYSFWWYEGRNINAGSTFYTDPTVEFAGDSLLINSPDPMLTYSGTTYAPRNTQEGPTIYALRDGIYSVVVEDHSNGCKEYIEINLPSVATPPAIVGNVTGSTICPYDVGNGTASAAIHPDSLIAYGYNNDQYNFYLYEGISTDGADLIGSAEPGDTGVGNFTLLSNALAPGYYTMQAVEQITASNCPSVPLTVFIDSLAKNPIVDLVSDIVSNNACDSASVNGAIELGVFKDPTDGTGPTTYDITWTQTSSTPPGDLLGVAGGPQPVFDNLNMGTYEVTVVDLNSTCQTIREYTLYNEPPNVDIEATDIVVIDKYACLPSGNIEVIELTVNGMPEPAGNYSFEWFDGDADLAAGNPIAGAVTENLDSIIYPTIHEGSYYVIATKDPAAGDPGAGCSTAPVRREILDRTVDPSLGITVSANQSCDPATIANGQIDLVVTPGTLSTNLFDFTWNSFPAANPGDLAAAGVNQSFGSLVPGDYEIEVLDVQSQCFTVNQITVTDNPIYPVVQDPDILITDQSICAPDGSITIADVILNGISDGTADYTFAWYNTADSLNLGFELNVIPVVNGPDLNAGNYAQIGAGNYYFTVTKNNPADPVAYGCESSPYQATINDISVDPVLALSQTPNQSCDTSVVANGTIAALVTPGSNSANRFNYTWNAFPTDRPTEFTGGTGGINESFINRSYGFYSLEIEDEDTKCTTTGSITVIDNPYIPVVLNVNITDQDICDYSGSIAVSDISPGTTAEYTFTWYDGLADLNSGSFIPGATGALIDIGTYATIQAGDYYFTAQKTDPTDPVGYMCESSPYMATINDISEDPLLALSMTANQSCDTAVVANGVITAVITPGLNSTNRFNYTWIDFPTDRPTEYNGGTGGLNETFTDRSYGQYILEIEDEDTKCRTTGSISVINNPFTPIIDHTDYLVNDQSVCFNDGSVIVFGIFPGDTSQYDFTWYEGISNLNNNIPIAGVADGILDTTRYASIQAGDYYFTATNVDPSLPIGYGCETAPILATIDDISVDPILALATTANENCDLSFANGTLLANASTGGVPGPSYSFTLTSSVLGAPIDSLLNDAQVLYDSLRPGNYNVAVIDDITLCVSNRSITVDDSPVFIEITDINYAVMDQYICAPDGSIIINSINENGAPQALSDYTYVWYDGESNLNVDNPISGVSDSYLDSTNFAVIGAGDYFFTVTKLASAARPGVGCESAPLRADIFDLHTDPNVIFNMLSNTSCEPANPNGVVLATAFENDGTDTDIYSFVWTYNGGPLPGSIVQNDSVNISRLTMAPEGDYQLTVVNSSRTQCIVNSGTPLDKVEEVPNIIMVDVTDPFFCYPTGAIEVTQIIVGGVPANVNDFEYEWYQNNFTPGDLILDSLGNPVLTPLLSDIYPNNYFVIARDSVTRCESVPKEVVVTDANIVYPTIQITQTAPQTSCDPMQPNASLSATADGGNDDTNPDYQFAWYNSLDASGPSIGTTSTIYGLGADEYSVSVLNVVTGCMSTDYYITEDDIFNNLPVVSVAASPQTNCIIDDGQVSAQVINYTGNFQFDWYIGDVIGMAPDYSGQVVSGLPPGLYTVTATELDTTYCTSQPVIVEVRDERISPEVLIEEDNPLTNCWVSDPNGQFSASVDGMVGGYTFEWYIGTDTTGIPDHNDATYSGLSPQTYTLVVTDIATNCSVAETVDLTDGTVSPPVADPEVVQHLQSCLEPDGWVRASVGGNIIDYIFDWYNGGTVGTSSDWTGVNYRDLDAGLYTVTAQDMITGCISEGQQVEVLDQREMPMFTFDVTPAHCEQSDGQIEIVWENNVPISSITWYDGDNGQYLEGGSALYQYPAGQYEVVVVSSYGCEEMKEVELIVEIFEFNGISANGDGKNDFFEVACITLYPDNHVRIYNRAGQLVYEEFGYNNNDRVFTGIGENGMYWAGRELPDGTYFYIIDKRDGSEPIAGYLELIR
jgi:gliding motility-associated-like protein